MTNANITKSMATNNVFFTVVNILKHEMPEAQYQSILTNEDSFKEFFGKAAKVAETVIEKYCLHYTRDGAKHFCALANAIRDEQLTRKDAVEMYQNPEKLYKFFDTVAKTIIISAA